MTAPKLARKARPGEPGFADGARVYEHPRTHKVVPSITAVKDMLDKAALKYWAAGRAADYASENIAALAAMADEKQRKELIRGAPWRESDQASAIGDTVHGWIDHYIKGDQSFTDFQTEYEAAPVTARHMWQSFMAFIDKYQPRWIDAEFTVWSNAWGYAGTMDWAAIIRGWLVLGDTKTGKSTHPDFGLQLAAGVYADFILRVDGTEIPLPKFDRCAVLHVRPRSATLEPLDKIPECWEAFKSCRVLKHWHDYVSPHVIQFAPKVQPVKEAK